MVQAHGRARMAVGEVQPPAGGTTLPHSVVPFQTSSIPTRAAGHPPALADTDGAAVEDSSNPSRSGQDGRPLVDVSHEYSTLPPQHHPGIAAVVQGSVGVAVTLRLDSRVRLRLRLRSHARRPFAILRSLRQT